MDYVVCLLTLKSSKKWRSPQVGATCNFNHQILPYGILFLTFIYCHLNFHANLLRPWRFPLTCMSKVFSHIPGWWRQGSRTDKSTSCITQCFVTDGLYLMVKFPYIYRIHTLLGSLSIEYTLCWVSIEYTLCWVSIECTLCWVVSL